MHGTWWYTESEGIILEGPDKKSLASVEDYDGGAYIKE